MNLGCCICVAFNDSSSQVLIQLFTSNEKLDESLRTRLSLQLTQFENAFPTALVVVPLSLIDRAVSIVHPTPPTPPASIPLPLIVLIRTVEVGTVTLGSLRRIIHCIRYGAYIHLM